MAAIIEKIGAEVLNTADVGRVVFTSDGRSVLLSD